MLNWLQAHVATMLVAALLLAAVVLAVVKIIRDQKSGKCSCGGQCSGCAMSGQCHVEEHPDKESKHL